MKEDLFMKKMIDRLSLNKSVNPVALGPVITISREYGCYGGEIAQLLSEKLSAFDKEKQWEDISSEILEEAAKLLDVETHKISHIFGASETSFFKDVMNAFSNYDKYTSDFSIKRTISNVVKSYAEQGHVVIVGRAGCILAQDIPKSLHVRIIGSHEWRISHVQERFKLTKQEALDKIEEMDKHRVKFMDFYRGNKPDSEIYDVVLNRTKLSTQTIVDTIYNLAKYKGLI